MGGSILAFMMRDVAASYRRQAGGYLWAVAEPVAGIALLTVVFSLAFFAPPLGDNFATFYATGLLPFTIYMQIQSRLMTALRASRPLLQYPAASFIDALISRALLAMLTQLVVFLVVFAGLVAVFDPRISPNPAGIALALAMVAILAIGIGVLNCLLIGLFPVWQRVWGVLNRPLFVISGIFFLFESVAEPWRSWLWYNPLIHVVGALRAALYPFYDASYVQPGYVIGLGVSALAAGLLFLRAHHREILSK